MFHMVKNLPAMQEIWVRKIPCRREWQPTPGFLPGESHGWRSLVAIVCGVAEGSDMTEHARTTTVTAVTLTSNSLPAICCEDVPFIISLFHLHKPSMESVV